MLHRAVALLLALVLIWSGFSTLEGPYALASSGTALDQALAADTGAAAGSVEDHHLDDLPSQAQADPPVEHMALLRASPHRHTAAVSAAWPQSRATAAPRGPCLAGLLRPPRRGPNAESAAFG